MAEPMHIESSEDHARRRLITERMADCARGDVRLMRRTREAQISIISLLTSDDVDLSGSQRAGLFIALEELADMLDDRADFIEERATE